MTNETRTQQNVSLVDLTHGHPQMDVLLVACQGALLESFKDGEEKYPHDPWRDLSPFEHAVHAADHVYELLAALRNNFPVTPKMLTDVNHGLWRLAVIASILPRYAEVTSALQAKMTSGPSDLDGVIAQGAGEADQQAGTITH